MARTEAQRLFDDLEKNGELRAAMQGKEAEEAAEIAAEHGYDVTVDDILAEVQARRKRVPANSLRHVADDEIDMVAGGAMGTAEDAPDGHEIGCVLVYHDFSWCYENDIYCYEQFYCYNNFNNCANNLDTNAGLYVGTRFPG